MTPEQLRLYIEGGLSIMVGTADADGVPSCCRAVALRPSDDLQTMTVYLPVATSQESVANIATTRRMAISCSFPIDATSVQIKGITRAVRLAKAPEDELVQRQLEKFAGSLEMIGLPRRLTRSLNHWPAFAVEMSVEEIFDQTPGPNAGERFQ